MISRRRAVVALAAALTGMLVLAACGGGGDGGSGGTGETIKIGFLGDLTGENSGLIIPAYNAAKMAVDEYNASNPPQRVELIRYDSQGSPDQAVPLAQQAVQQDRIVGLIGPGFSGESRAVGPILEEAGIPSVSASATNVALAQNGWRYWHRVVANDADQGPAIVDFLVRVANPTRAFVISDDQEYSVGLADTAQASFQQRGIQVERDQFAQSASDYSSTVARVRAFNPDVVVFGGYFPQAGRLLKQLRDNGVTALFASGDGTLDPGLISGAGAAAAEGAIVACPCNIPFGATEGRLGDFSRRYREATGSDPAIYATEGYDAATLFLNAIREGNTTPDAINNHISSASLDGVSKQISFKPNGEPNVNAIFVYQVKNGQFTLLGQSTEAALS